MKVVASASACLSFALEVDDKYKVLANDKLELSDDLINDCEKDIWQAFIKKYPGAAKLISKFSAVYVYDYDSGNLMLEY